MITLGFADVKEGAYPQATKRICETIANLYNQYYLFGYFDTSRSPQGESERFYHGFVRGLMVEWADRYVVTSNRKSGFGRYDVMLGPRTVADDAIILEFKVQDEEEKELGDTVQQALRQIQERNYQACFIARRIPWERIRGYGFAFCWKKVLIGEMSRNGD